MDIIIYALLGLLVLLVDYKLHIRNKYQTFSGRFTKYYIDFITFLIAFAIIAASLCLLFFFSTPEFLINYIIIFMLFYTLFIILPAKSIDDFVQNIYSKLLLK